MALVLNPHDGHLRFFSPDLGIEVCRRNPRYPSPSGAGKHPLDEVRAASLLAQRSHEGVSDDVDKYGPWNFRPRAPISIGFQFEYHDIPMSTSL